MLFNNLLSLGTFKHYSFVNKNMSTNAEIDFFLRGILSWTESKTLNFNQLESKHS